MQLLVLSPVHLNQLFFRKNSTNNTFYLLTLKKIMKQFYLFIAAFIFTYCAFGQTIQVSGISCPSGTMDGTYTYQGEYNGKPFYQSPDFNVIVWGDDSKWFFGPGVIYTNSNPTLTPPTTGWVRVDEACSTASSIILTGDVTLTPVELTFFKGKSVNEDILLQWQTATEDDNLGFNIHRSLDCFNWKSIDFVNGNRTTIEIQNYSFIDRQPSKGINYYRLKQIDFDGAFEYSEVISVNMLKENPIINIIPNPAKETFELLLPTHEEAGIVHILDDFGRLVLQSTTQQPFYNVDDLASGFYVVIIELKGKRHYEKLIID